MQRSDGGRDEDPNRTAHGLAPPWAVSADVEVLGVALGVGVAAGFAVVLALEPAGGVCTAAEACSKKMTSSKFGRRPDPQGMALRV